MSFKTKKQEVINFSKRNWKAITGTLVLGVGTTVVIAKAKKDKENIVVSDKALDNVMPYEEYYESEWEDRLVQVKTGDYDHAKEVLLENGISLIGEEDYGEFVRYEVEDDGENEVTKEDLELEDKPEDDAE